MSLIIESWLPVRLTNGQRRKIRPDQLSEPDIVAFAASRADFNNALAQFAIGLLQSAVPELDAIRHQRWFHTPPDEATLHSWFAPLTSTFIFDGDAARFMQDRHLKNGTTVDIDGLLIDAAGDSTTSANTDLFVKRNNMSGMCPACAVTALLALQINAPAGGAGHRTSLRGGGPLTTLLVSRAPDGSRTGSLWKDLWLNVQTTRQMMPHGLDPDVDLPHLIYPWLAEVTAIQKEGTSLAPAQLHPLHVFWAMPRRIRLDFASTRAGRCDLCHQDSPALLTRYHTRPQGLNYKGPWRHPLSPYYEIKEEWLPVHPQPGGFTWKYWAAWTTGMATAKTRVCAAAVFGTLEDGDYGETGLWLAGYDMENMKARCWYETTFPLFRFDRLNNESRRDLEGFAQCLTEGAEHALFCVRRAIQQARFGEGDVRGDLSYISKIFWDRTQSDFYAAINSLARYAADTSIVLSDHPENGLSRREQWRKTLDAVSRNIFEEETFRNGICIAEDPASTVRASRQLRQAMNGKEIRKILRLPELVFTKPAKSAKADKLSTSS